MAWQSARGVTVSLTTTMAASQELSVPAPSISYIGSREYIQFKKSKERH